MPKIGGIGLSAKDFKEVVEEVIQAAAEARQAAYDTVMEVLSFKETVTPGMAKRILAQLIEAGQESEFAAANPKDYRQLLELALEEIV